MNAHGDMLHCTQCIKREMSMLLGSRGYDTHSIEDNNDNEDSDCDTRPYLLK